MQFPCTFLPFSLQAKTQGDPVDHSGIPSLVSSSLLSIFCLTNSSFPDLPKVLSVFPQRSEIAGHPFPSLWSGN